MRPANLSLPSPSRNYLPEKVLRKCDRNSHPLQPFSAFWRLPCISLRRPCQPLEVNSMLCRLLMRTAICSLVVSMAPAIGISAQQPSPSSTPASALPPQESATSVALASNGNSSRRPNRHKAPALASQRHQHPHRQSWRFRLLRDCLSYR